MDKYASDSTVIASAQNDVARGETVWTPLLCGLYCTWRQKRLHEAAFYAAQGHAGFAEYLERFRFGIYHEA
jgi:hypothetical protein